MQATLAARCASVASGAGRAPASEVSRKRRRSMPGWWGRRGSGVNVEDRATVARHRACGTMTGDATEPEPSGYMLTVSCSCGVSFLRWVTVEEAARELLE